MLTPFFGMCQLIGYTTGERADTGVGRMEYRLEKSIVASRVGIELDDIDKL